MADLNDNKLQIKFKKLYKSAKAPTKAHETDAGWDLYCLARTSIGASNTELIDTGICVNIPAGYVGVIKDRSSKGSQGFSVLGGVIDAGYTGPIKVIVHNTMYKTRYIETDEKVAQMLILPVPDVEFVEVDSLEETERANKGFGSSDLPKIVDSPLVK